MKKIQLIAILIIAIVGAYLIYNKFDDNDISNVNSRNNIISEYKNLDEEHILIEKNIDEIQNILDKTGIIFICTPTSDICQSYASVLNEVLKANDIKSINYIDITEERSMASSKYKKLVSKLKDQLEDDDTGNKSIKMPLILFVKDGEVINKIDSTNSSIEESIDELKELITNDVIEYNQKEIIINE